MKQPEKNSQHQHDQPRFLQRPHAGKNNTPVYRLLTDSRHQTDNYHTHRGGDAAHHAPQTAYGLAHGLREQPVLNKRNHHAHQKRADPDNHRSQYRKPVDPVHRKNLPPGPTDSQRKQKRQRQDQKLCQRQPVDPPCHLHRHADGKKRRHNHQKKDDALPGSQCFFLLAPVHESHTPFLPGRYSSSSC